MTKFKLLTGIAGALAVSASLLGSVSSANAENIRRSEPCRFGCFGGNSGGGEFRGNRAERRANRAERRARKSERRANRAERRQRRARRANRDDRRFRRAERRANRRYNRRRHGNRFRARRRGYRHFYDGYYYANPWWLYAAPVIAYGVGSGYGGSNYDRHVEWCEDRYRSYNERRDAYKGYDGYWHTCNSPYS